MTDNMKKTKINSDLKALSRLAHRMATEGKYKEAEEKYTLALKMDKNNAYVLVGLGDLKRKTRRFKEAVHYYQRSLEVEKKNKLALAGLGDAYRGLREVDKALEVWLHYLSLNPDDYKVMTRVADGFRRKGNIERAKKYYCMALRENPDDPYAFMGLGDIYVREGNDEKALEFFEKLIRISDSGPGEPVMALTSAANIYRKRRQYGKAMDYYERVLEVDQQNSHAWHGKADSFRGIKDYPAAIKAWRIALECGMDSRIAITRIGDAYMSMKDLEQAEVNYNKALALGYYKYAYLGMARIHIRRNHVDKALEIFSKLSEKEPNDSLIAAEFRGFIEKHPQVKDAVPNLIKIS